MPKKEPSTFDLIYRIVPARPEAHLLEVELSVHAPGRASLTLAMPAWIPGSYMIRDFARNLTRISAEDVNGVELTLIKRDKQTWELPEAGMATHPIRIRYQVFAWELSVRAAHLDATHCYFNGPAVLLGVSGLMDRPCRIELIAPQGEDYADWRVGTSLPALDAPPFGFGAYWASDYQSLIDHPVEMGAFALFSFIASAVPHAMIISGRHHTNAQRLTHDLARICEQQVALFGDLPVERYMFLAAAVGEGYGGLEHRDSSSLICSRCDLPRPNEPDEPSEGYRRFLGLCSHEYFHLWNGKRIRPEVFVDPDLSHEVHTRLLWAVEGITSYYDDLALVRSGCISQKAYLQCLAENITKVMRTPGRLVQTVAQSSFDAWTKLYKQDENAPNAIVSYYSKGALIALALDLTIRRDTKGGRSLDDVMRALWVNHGLTGAGVPERGIESMVKAVTNLDLGDFFDRALDSTEDLDLQSLLATMGIVMRFRPSRGPKDLGGCVDRFDKPRYDLTLAVRLRAGGREAVIESVLTGGAGELAGLAPGDLVMAVDGLRATSENLDHLVNQAGRDGAVRLHVFRRDELFELWARPRPAMADACELMALEPAPDSATRARASWLASLL